jgi:hypothetical protein
MNPDGSACIHAELAIGARFPHLLWIGIGALGGGALLSCSAASGSTSPRRAGPCGFLRSPDSVEP